MGMSLSSLHLDAFTEVARLRSFSQAAKKLNVTQSALSQRVLNLEEELGSSLFIRETSGIRLTDLGQRLLRYCHSRGLLESEFMESLHSAGSPSLSGLVRVAGFSTVNRSVLLPLFAEFLREHPGVNIEMRTQELRDLPGLLFSGAAEIILTTSIINKQDVECHLLGLEENVLIQSTNKNARRDWYLDHDEEDTTTQDFFKAQTKKSPVLKRNFLGDIYSIIDGVRLGVGRAVVPQHLIRDAKGIEVVRGQTPLKTPVYLCYYTQAFYTELQKSLTALLQARVGKLLKD